MKTFDGAKWISNSSSEISVRDFGAVGDGVTDDTASLTAACAAAQGKVLHFASGKTYAIQSKVVLSDGITIEGHGATLVKPANSTDNLSLVKGTPTGFSGYGAGGSGITIRDLTIQGNYSVSRGYGDCTSSFHHVSDLAIERCQFTQGLRGGHYLDLAGCNNVSVRDCFFIGADPDNGREYAEAIQIDCSTYAGQSDKSEPLNTIDGLPTRGVSVTHCTFLPLVLAGTEYPMPSPMGSHSNALTTDAGYYRDIAFTDNTVQGWLRDSTSYWASWVMLTGAQGVIISRNLFSYTGPNMGSSRGVVSIRKAESATPENQLTSSSPVSTPLTRYSSGVTISDNVFRGFETFWKPSEGHGLITIYNAGGGSDIGISGNRITGCNGESMRVYGGPYDLSSITGNNITSREGIRINQANCLVEGNTLKGSSTPVVGVAFSNSSTPINCIGNIVTGYPTGISVDAADNGLVQSNFLDRYTLAGIRIGQDAGSTSGTAFDVTVSSNRMRSPDRTSETKALHIGAKSTRAMRFGNRTREGGSVLDEGSGTINGAADAS